MMSPAFTRKLPRFCDLLGDAPDHLLEVRTLPYRAVDGERDRALGEMTNFSDRMDRAEHRGVIKALADFPRLLFRGHAVLQVAPRHIEAQRVAIDVIKRLVGRDIGAA